MDPLSPRILTDRARAAGACARPRRKGNADELSPFSWGVFQPEFAAVCDTCTTTTLWFKANRVAQREDGRPAAIKGYKCVQCETFETKVLDTRGAIRERG